MCVFSERMNMEEKTGKAKENKCKIFRLNYVILTHRNINWNYPHE